MLRTNVIAFAVLFSDRKKSAFMHPQRHVHAASLTYSFYSHSLSAILIAANMMKSARGSIFSFFFPIPFISVCSFSINLIMVSFCCYSLCFVSIQMVTGPSLSSSTFMSAPNSPVPTDFPSAVLRSLQNFSYSGTESSCGAA